MADPAEQAAAYRDAVRRAEEAAESGVTPQEIVTTLETPAEEVAEPVEVSEVEPVTPVETETPTEQEVQEEKLFAGKYKSAEELERAYLETQTVIGRQGSELGELRSTVDEIRQQMQTPAQPPAFVMPITQDQIDNDPADATLRAFAAGDEATVARAFNAWRDEDPFNASAWLNDRKLEAQQRTFEARIAEQEQRFQAVAAPAAAAVQRDQEQATWREAFALVEGQSPGFTAEAVRLLEEVAPQFPSLAEAIAKGDAKAKAEGLTLLYSFDRGRTQDPAVVAAEAAAEARAAVEEATATRAAAAVVQQDTAGVGGSEAELTPEQAEAQRTIDRIRSKPSLAKGWTGREGFFSKQ